MMLRTGLASPAQGRASRIDASHPTRLASSILLSSFNEHGTAERQPSLRTRKWMADEKEIESTLRRTLQTVDEEEDIRTLSSSSSSSSSVAILGNSRIFEILFAILLGLIAVVRLFCFGAIVALRQQGNLRLAQPSILAVLVLAGSVSIASCYFLILHNDVFCQLRDPMILIPLTLAGSILLGRLWRILLLLTPVLELLHIPARGRSRAVLSSAVQSSKPVDGQLHSQQQQQDGGAGDGEGGEGEEEPTSDESAHHVWLVYCKVKLLQWLTKLADTYHFVCHPVSCATQTSGNRRRTNLTLKKQVPIQQCIWLIFMLLFPQIILQICQLAIPPMRGRLIHIQIWVIQDHLEAIRPVCQSPTGQWSTYLGVALALLPYSLTGILAWNSSDDLPKVFDEARAMARSFRFLVLVMVVALPPLLFLGVDREPDTFVWLTAMLVFGVAIPPVWYIVYPKVWQAYRDQTNNAGQPLQVRKLLQKRREKKFLPNATSNQDQGRSAKLALTIGKMYEDMGLHQKSIDLFDEALAVWECDPNRSTKDKIGGYTLDEIDAFSVADLECIIQLLIAKGRVVGTFHSGEDNSQKQAAQSWLDALEIYERAPTRAKIKDRSFLFPIFSGIFVFLKGGKIQQDDKCYFEQNLVRKFVRETKLQGDPIHYTRALAMYCETKGRLGRYKAALETFDILKEIYDPLEHSEGVAAAYGTDRSAQAYSQAALWQLQAGNEEAALAQCDYVLNQLVPSMDPSNVLNMCELLLPIVRIYKPRGKAKQMRALFDKHVVQNFNKYFGKDGVTPCKPVFKPLLTLLDLCDYPKDYPHLVDTVEWLVEGENGVIPDFLDSVYAKLCWSMHSLTAELCLRVAKQLIAMNGELSDIQLLIEKGLGLARRAEKKLKHKKGHVILPIAYELHAPVFTELIELADTMGLVTYIEDDGQSGSKSSSKNSSLVNGKNLPNSYYVSSRVTLNTSEGGSNSSASPAMRRSSAKSFATIMSNTSSQTDSHSKGEEEGTGLMPIFSELSLMDLMVEEEPEQADRGISERDGRNDEDETDILDDTEAVSASRATSTSLDMMSDIGLNLDNHNTKGPSGIRTSV